MSGAADHAPHCRHLHRTLLKPENAARQFGHENTRITGKHYVESRAYEAPDLTELLDGLRPPE